MYKYLASIEDNAAPFKEEQTRYERLCIWFLLMFFKERVCMDNLKKLNTKHKQEIKDEE